MEDGFGFQNVRRLSDAELKTRLSWKKFRERVLPEIGQKWIAEEVKTYCEKHTDADRKQAQQWAENHWKTKLSTKPSYAQELESVIAKFEPRAAQGAWKKFKAEEFRIVPQEPKKVAIKAFTEKTKPTTSFVSISANKFGDLESEEEEED